ncbi:MAG TPA: serine hydrolase [Cytophagales bacterium]|nr:serine hydrolase [Cytophagales bacterium]
MEYFKVKQTKFVILFIIILSGCNDQVSNDHSVHSPALDAFITEVYNTYPLPGITVGVVTEEGTYFKSLGFSDLDKKLPISDSTIFFMGEFSELLVSTGMLKLDELGSLSVEDKVVKHLPYFKTQGAYDKISIHHLLTHTSGIPKFSPAWDMPSFASDALEATTRSIVFQDLEFSPGSQRKKSPYNYDIAADLMAKVSNTLFEEVMEKNVFEPLHMSQSYFNIQEIKQEQLVKPHAIKDWLKYDFTLFEPYPYTRENAGSFGLHSTTSDMTKWMKMVLELEEGAGLLSDKSLSELMREFYKTGKDTYKGYGWNVLKTNENTIYNNEWSLGGFSGDISLFPDKKIGIIVVANTSGDFNPTVISERIAHFLNGGELKKVKLPIHIEMSRKLSRGETLTNVLKWHDSLMAVKDPTYLFSPAILNQLGANLLRRVDRKEDALIVFRHCVEKYPDSPEAYLNLTEGLLVTGQIDEAEKHFQKAHHLNPKLNSPYVNFIKEQLMVAREREPQS